jgi:hypothetical protein
MPHTRKRGFSLVLSLTIMAALVMLVVVLAAFLQVESRLATTHSAYLRARLNAVVAGRLAIAQLQTLAGHDQRVTARMDLLDGTKPGTSLNSYLQSKAALAVTEDKKGWTGVWCTGGADQSKVRDWVVTSPDKRLFLGYLVSADPSTGLAVANLTPSRLLNSTDATAMDQLLRSVATIPSATVRTVPLLAYGTIAKPATGDGRVKVPPLPLPAPGASDAPQGNYAWWTGDESIKAKINLSETYASTPSVWDKGLLYTAARRTGQETLGGVTTPAWSSFKLWADADLLSIGGAKLSFATSAGDLGAWATAATGNAANGVIAAGNVAKYHGDLTLRSFGVLSDTYNGGLRTDLSIAFELPHEDFKLLGEFHDSPGAPGDRNVINLASAYGFSAANTPSFAEWGDTANKLGFVFEAPIPNQTSGPSMVPPPMGTNQALIDQGPRSVAAAGSFPNGTKDYTGDDWTVRGPTWLLMRNFYRLYKRELETTGARGQPPSSADAWFARTAEPFTYSSGVTGWSCVGDPSGPGYLGEKYNAGILHRKARMLNYGGGNWVRTTYQPHQFSRVWWSTGGGQFPQPTAMKLAPTVLRHTQRWGVIYNQDTLGVTFDPIITLHNPYNVPLEFTGFGAYFNKFYPLALTFSRINPGTGAEEPLNLAGVNTNGISFANGVFYPHTNGFNRSFAVRWVANEGAVLRMNPGEIVVIGCEGSTNTGLSNNGASIIRSSRGYDPDKARHYYRILGDSGSVVTATGGYPLLSRMYAAWVPTSGSNSNGADASGGYWDGIFINYNLMHYKRDNGSVTYPLAKVWGGENYAECDGSDEGLINRTGFFTCFYPDAATARKVLAQKTISRTGETSNAAYIERTFVGVMDLRWRSPADARNVDNLSPTDGRGVGAGTASPLVADMRYDATDPRDWDADSLQSPPMILSFYPDPGSFTPVDMTSDNKGYYGNNYKVNEGRTETVLFEVPQRPMLSLTGLGHAQFGTYATQPAYTVGNSFPHIGLPSTAQTLFWPNSCVSPKGTVDNGTADFGTDNGNTSTIRTDSAFLANLALWDRYYFSGAHAAMPNVARNTYAGGTSTRIPAPAVVTAGNQKTSLADVWDDLAAGNKPLANKRFVWGRFTDGRSDTELRNDFYRKPSSTPRPAGEAPSRPERVAKQFLYDGAFNVNSTSKEAWRLMLASLRGVDVSGTSVFSRFGIPPNTTDVQGAGSYWGLKFHSLTDAEIDKLADNLVAEVRRRGPFMSLADFVNRRLTTQTTGLKGPLQAAIDAAGLNDYAVASGKMKEGFATKVTTEGGRFPQAKAFDPAAYSATSNTQGAGAFPSQAGSHSHLLQMQVLNAIGPSLTVRGDTFVVRAYGESVSSTGEVLGKAWVELTVQRMPELLIPDDREPTVALGALPVGSTISVPAGSSSAGDNNGGGGGFGGYRSPTITNYATSPIMERWVRNKDANRVNNLLGRRFKVTALRWLRDSDI